MDNDQNNESYRYWQEKAIGQLTLTNQFLTALSLGFLAFCFNEFDFKLFTFPNSFEGIVWSITFQALAVWFILISVILGILVIFVRLIDFRITRNISLSKVRIREELKKNNLWVEESQLDDHFDLEFDKPIYRKRVCLIFNLLLCEPKLISRKDIKKEYNNPNFYKKVNELRELSFRLGIISWKIPNQQLFLIIVSVILYVTSLII